MSKRPKNVTVGLDVGSYSLGIGALEMDESNEDPLKCVPIKVLEGVSWIHDGSVDPSAGQSKDSRKRVSGERRRARTRIDRAQDRCKRLDTLLESLGYPLLDPATTTLWGDDSSYLPWTARVKGAEEYLENDAERRACISLACRHIIRHHGWRNPYAKYETLAAGAEHASQFYVDFLARQQKALARGVPAHPEWAQYVLPGFSVETVVETNRSGREIRREVLHGLPASEELGPNRKTVGQLVYELICPDGPEGPRVNEPAAALRKHNDKDPTERPHIGKLHQSDLYHELKRILDTQRVAPEEQDAILKLVFEQTSPRQIGAAAQRVAKDDLPPHLPRASKASPAFQRYRVAATVANLRVQDANGSRPLAESEFASLVDWLSSDDSAKQKPTWGDVAKHLGIPRRQLKGVGGMTEDGEPISAKNPPVLETSAQVLVCGAPQVVEWWKSASDDARELLVDSLSNAGSTFVASQEAQDELQALWEVLDEESAAKLDALQLAPGRAAHCVETLRTLTDTMVNSGCDLFTARRTAYGLSDDWRPSPNPLGTPVGNPAADLVIKEAARRLRAIESRYGAPSAVVIECTRDGFSSAATKQQIQADQRNRYRANEQARNEIRELRGEDGKVTKNDLQRHRSIQMQNNRCLYCGAEISFATCEEDHIVARKGGGSSNTADNLVGCCHDCNVSKDKTPFATWAATNPRDGKVTLKEAMARVDGWTKPPRMSVKDFKRLQKGVKERLRLTDLDEPLDERSVESVAWMARELADQIRGAYPDAQVIVYRGSVTAAARSVSGIERTLPWHGGAKSKTRLDRRHHAVDALTLACLPQTVAQVLMIREGRLADLRARGERLPRWEDEDWTDYAGRGKRFEDFEFWRDHQMARLADITGRSMVAGKIAVDRPLRLGLSMGKAHDDTVRPLQHKRLGEAMSAEAIDKVETPALWSALTSLPAYDPATGLPEDPTRSLRVKGRSLSPRSWVGFMAPEGEIDKPNKYGSPALRVRGGYAENGNTCHHIRLFMIPDGKGSWRHTVLRVYLCDLVGNQGASAFGILLPPSSITMRCATPELKRALREGTAVQLDGWLSPGDRIDFDPVPVKGGAKLDSVAEVFKCQSFVLVSADTNNRFLLRPWELAGEGAPDSRTIAGQGVTTWQNDAQRKQVIRAYGRDLSPKEADVVHDAVANGAKVVVNKVLRGGADVVRRNALGFDRRTSGNSMPCSFHIPSVEEFQAEHGPSVRQ